ncbi:DUF192 domain-containing protein [Marinobacter sp. C2H3]|uniref:DUF192 domain-containing protein n=1 Tax=Marinobacter sp. C2H3 TaxID=3119003 RepID=UPI00300EA5DE
MSRLSLLRGAALAILAGLSTGCQSEGPSLGALPQTGLPEARACFLGQRTDTARPTMVSVTLEVTNTDRQRQAGLMQRPDLHDSAGMLFEYGEQRPASSGFWMYQTLIPLDIAYLDRQRTIRSIRTMTPCDQANGLRCPTYASAEPYWSAVEMNAGFFRRHDLGVGDRLLLNQPCPNDG